MMTVIAKCNANTLSYLDLDFCVSQATRMGSLEWSRVIAPLTLLLGLHLKGYSTKHCQDAGQQCEGCVFLTAIYDCFKMYSLNIDRAIHHAKGI